MNIGKAKGLEYDRVLIYPVKGIIDWIKGKDELSPGTRAKFYVALTRARHGAFIVYDYSDDEIFVDGIRLYDETRRQGRLF